jgi:competence protein ComEC
VGTLPLMALFYNLFSPVALLANLVVIPGLMGIVGLGIFSTASFWFSPWLAATWNNANWLMVKGLSAAVRWGDHFSWSHQFVVAPPMGVIVTYYALLLLGASGWLGQSRWRWMSATGAAIACVLVWGFYSSLGNSLQITVLHTNGGQSILVEPPRGEGFLLDAGSEPAGKYVVLPFLRSRGVDQLDALVMSQRMGSYAGGFAPILEKISAARILDTDAPSHSKVQQDLGGGRFLRRTVRRGDEIQTAPGCKIRVLNPPTNTFYNRANDNSLVLLLEFQGRRVLFTSAAGETVEQELLASGEDLRADVIVKAQHETESSCSEAFLDRVRPQTVIFSVGEYPRANYLRVDALERLQRRNLTVYRTDLDGSVNIRIHDSQIRCETFLLRHRVTE